MNGLVGTASLTATFFGAPLVVPSVESALIAAAVAGSLILLRRTHERSAGASDDDAFAAYREARQIATGRACG